MAAATTTASKKDLWWLHDSIVFFLMFLLRYVMPPVYGLTPEGVSVLCIFLGLIYGWGFAGLLVPSLMAMVALGFTGLYSVSEIIVQGFGNDIVIFCVMMFVIVGCMIDTGITEIFARWLLTRKFLQGRPWAFSAMLCFVAYVVVALSNNFIAMFFVWGMWYGIFKTYHFKPYTPYVTLMLLGTIVATTLGSFILPFRGTGLVMLSAFSRMVPGIGTINFAAYMLAVVPVTLLLFAVYMLICKFVFRPDIRALTDVDASTLIAKRDMGPRQIVTAAVFLGIIAALLLPTFLPADFLLTKILKNLGFTGLAFIACLILVIVRVDGKPIMNFGQMAKDNVIWDAFFMMVVIMLLSPIMSNAATGINTFIVSLLSPLMGVHSPYLFMLIFCGALFFLTNFFNNTIMGFLFMNIVAAAFAPLGLEPWTLMTLLLISMHLAIFCPAASGQVAILFGLSDWLKPSDLYKVTSITVIAWAITFLTVGIVYVRFIFGLLR